MTMDTNEFLCNIVCGEEGTPLFQELASQGNHTHLARTLGKLLHDNPDAKLMFVHALIHTAVLEGSIDVDEAEVLFEQSENVFHDIIELFPNG